MNNYGYLIYEDYPRQASASIRTSYNKQTGTEDIKILTASDFTSFENWASFEKNEFDFRKKVWLAGTNKKIANTSTIMSDEFGLLEGEPFIEIIPTEAYSGSGFSLFTYNDYYEIRIVISDMNGTRQKEFHALADEFYEFEFNGLTYLRIDFLKIQPHHFIKVAGINFGTIRIIDEKDLASELEINNNFSLTGEELPYDTLDFTVNTKLNFVAGEKITYTRTNQAFYVNTATPNNNGTISVSCYDDIARLENNRYGSILENADAKDRIAYNLKGKTSDITVEVKDLIINNQTFSGKTDTQTYRQTSQMVLQGNGGRLRKQGNSKFVVFNPMKNETISAEFIEDNIKADSVSIEISQPILNVSFTKHIYKIDKADGKQEAFRGLVEVLFPPTTIKFNEPFTNKSYYYVSGTTAEGEDILTPVSSSKFEILSSGTYYVTVNNSYYETIVIKAYPYKESYFEIEAVRGNKPNTFIDNSIDISYCTVLYDGTTYTKFREFLLYIYSFNKKVLMESNVEANAGDYVSIKFDNNDLKGWVTKKIDTATGLYGYEVACK